MEIPKEYKGKFALSSAYEDGYIDGRDSEYSEYTKLTSWTDFLNTYKSEHKLSQGQLAVRTNIPVPTLHNYLIGSHNINFTKMMVVLNKLGYELWLRKKE